MISVAMATYIGELYIRQQLESIFNQTIKIDELVICDDCSTDDTLSIVKDVAKKYNAFDKCKIIVNARNVGYIANFKKAIAAAHGDYIFLCDQDDVWRPDKVEKMTKTIQETGAMLLASNFCLIDKNGNELKDQDKLQLKKRLMRYHGICMWNFSDLVFDNKIPGCTYCFCKEAKEAFLNDYVDYIPHDYQLILLSALIGTVYYTDDCLIEYRIHDTNTIGLGGNKTAKLIRKIGKPKMVSYLETLEKHYKLCDFRIFKIAYYLRIPLLKSILTHR